MTAGRPVPAQIPLPFRQYDHYELDQFRIGDNHAAIDHLTGLCPGTGRSITCLWGVNGTGKSHLLQAMCARMAARDGRSAYLPLAQHAELDPAMLQGLEELDLVCMDDVEAIAGEEPWEYAVFHLFNGLADAGRALIFSAGMSPRGLPLGLPDLKSRLQSSLIFHLLPLTEVECLEALRQRARLRGLELNDEVVGYISRRLARDTHSLFRLLDRLDQASLAAKKKLTVPFVKELLEEGES